MAIKIGIINGKGGVGKTTASTHIGGLIHTHGHRVCIVDTDPQGSLRDWRNVQSDTAELPTVVGVLSPTIHKEIPGIESSFEYIVIDGTSKINLMNSSIIKTVDLALIPIQPSVYDIWGAAETIELIKERQIVTDGQPKAAFVITMDKKNTRLSRDIVDAVNSLDFPLLQSRISEREIYKQSVPKGELAFTCGRKRDRNAALEEISLVLQESLALIKES